MRKYSKIRYFMLFFAFVGLLNCSAGISEDNDESENESPLVYTLKPNQEYQTVQGFGASDAWACQFVGANWADEKKEQIADWLFSSDTDIDGNPKGIGLSVWRFNIGGGSTEQGSESDIEDSWRRAESFLTGPDQYDWTKQAGQRWFLEAAKVRGVEDFIAFVNSPPVLLTENGKAYSSSPDQYNLAEENYAAYVDFLGTVLQHFSNDEGIDFNYISPFNEPQWDWMSAGQEGTPAQNSEIAALTRLLNDKLEGQSSSTKIEIPETAQIDYLFETSDKEGRGNQVEEFFSSSSENYVGNLSRVAHKIAGHSYFSTWDFDHRDDVRQTLVEKINTVDPSLEYWMSEYCILEDNDMIQGSGKDLSMTAALYLARVIHADLTKANASSWQWWTAISPYDYKDGLIYIDRNENDGAVSDSKMLWVLGNYSRFIRPGMKRIEVNDSEVSSMEFSGYETDNGKQFVFIIQNYKPIANEFQLSVDNVDDYNFKAYLTSSGNDENLKLVNSGSVGDTITLPGNSVMTVVLEVN
ncbi:glycoside hydrolase [Mangrovibacterium diazotrophicum]|nr:glycoside hydrolase [Mangrovibacterium diazotrophicum]